MENLGKIREVSYCEGKLSEDAFYGGLRRYAQIAELLGMGSNTGCHSRFMAFSQNDGPVVEFVFNEAGSNAVDAKAEYMQAHPELDCIPDVDMGETRTTWPGGVRLHHIDDDENDELCLINSGVPAYMDILLVAAFAAGVKEVDADWMLYGFGENNTYAWALLQVKRFIQIIDGKLDAVSMAYMEDAKVQVCLAAQRLAQEAD